MFFMMKFKPLKKYSIHSPTGKQILNKYIQLCSPFVDQIIENIKTKGAMWHREDCHWVVKNWNHSSNKSGKKNKTSLKIDEKDDDWVCIYNCGFKGTYQEVANHEKFCPNNPNAVKRNTTSQIKSTEVKVSSNKSSKSKIVDPGTTANVFLINCPEEKENCVNFEMNIEYKPYETKYPMQTVFSKDGLEKLSYYEQQREIENRAEENLEYIKDLKAYEKAYQEHITRNENIKKQIFSNLLQEIILKEGDKVKEGDLVEDCKQSGYRTGGVYLIRRNTSGKLELGDLDKMMIMVILERFFLGPI